MKKIFGKKGVISINQIVPIILVLVIAAFIVGIGVLSSSELRDAVSTDVGSFQYMPVNNSIGAMFNLTAQLPLFGTIVGLFIILGVIFLLVRGNVSVR